MYNLNVSSMDEAATYAVYMIMGSYFKKAVCKSAMKEDHLKLVYAETKRDNQIKFEERCINYIDNKIVTSVPEEIFNDMVEVHFVPNKKYNRIDVVFNGFDWELTMWATNSAKGVMFDYKFKPALIQIKC